MEPNSQNPATPTPPAEPAASAAPAGEPLPPRRGFLWMAVTFVLIIAIPLILYYLWATYFSPQAAPEQNNNVQQYQAAMKTYEDAMRADTYGGKTPEETLAMFIDALKKGDTELASKYFLLEQNTNDPNYLTRKKWEDELALAKQGDKLTSIANLLQSAVPDKENISGPDDYKFAVYSGDGSLGAYVNMQLNKYSGVWKIESL